MGEKDRSVDVRLSEHKRYLFIGFLKLAFTEHGYQPAFKILNDIHILLSNLHMISEEKKTSTDCIKFKIYRKCHE